MKRLKRTTAYVLAAVLSLSSFLQPVTVSAAAETETGKIEEPSKTENQEEQTQLKVSVTEGKGSVQLEDEMGNTANAAAEEPLTLDCALGTVFDVIVTPESGYQIAFYRTMTDTGEVLQDEAPALEGEEVYENQIKAGEISSIQVGFTEAADSEKQKTKETAEKAENDVEKESEETEDIPENEESPSASTNEENEIPDYVGLKIPNGYALQPASDSGISLLATTEDNTIDLIVGEEVPWSNYRTRHYTLTDGSTAFCLQPMKKYPDAGVHEITEIRDNTDEIAKVLYYGYGGPGWDQAGIDQGDFNSNYTITHLMGSYIYNDYDMGMDSFGIIDYTHVQKVLAAYDKVMAMPDPPEDVVALLCDTGHNSETGEKSQVMGVLGYRLENGSIEIHKSSANTELTEGNSAYSLAGAEYGVYLPGTDEQIALLVTDEQGFARADNIQAGDYEIKELAAPEGYALDTSAGSVTVEAGETAVYTCTDKPQSDPVAVLLGKIDAETNQNKPQGSASLANAEFTIKYYKGFYDTDPAEQGVSPERSWVMKTNESGYCRLSNTFKVSGDDFYYMSNGEPTLPLGTITIQETKAPTGYLINSTVFIRQITSEGNIEGVSTYNQPTIPEPPQKGIIRIQKVDAENTAAQGNGTLEGAVYEVRNSSNNEVAATLTTDKNGKAESGKLPLGSYTVKEKTASTGYQVDPQTYQVELTAEDATSEVFYKDVISKENIIRGGVTIEKRDEELDATTPQGDASLKGTEIQIINQSEQSVKVGEKVYKTGEVVLTLVTDENGVASTSASALPYGTYKWKESKQPTGYTAAGVTEGIFDIREQGKLISLRSSDTAVKNEVIRGGVELAKWSLETDERKPQGSATLGGAKFTITNKSAKAVLVDGQLFQPGEVIATVTTEENGLWKSGKDWLPFGTYEVAEVQEPEGYLPDGAQPKTFQIREDGKIVSLDNENGAVKNQVKRGDLNFVKVADSTLERLANVPFKITSKTTGESHTVVSDVNGQVDTSSAWNPHSQNTNRGETSEDGIWFSGTTEKEVPVNDEKGALPYDTYLIEEQRCEANKDYKLLSIEVKVYKDNYTIPLGTLTDDSDLVEITTTAMDSATEGHYAPAEKNTTIVDTVEYTNLKKGETYTIKGILMNKATGEAVKDAEGNPVTAEKTFTAKKVNGTMEMEFTFDAASLAGADVVVFEELYQGENLIAEHTDITDEDQTIHFPEIGTKAMDQETGTNVSKADEEITLTDTVSYSNLQPGRKYELTGTLMDKDTGEPVKDAEGKEITAKTSFKPEASDGTVNVTFTFDGSKLAGKTLVVFESLERNDTVYAVHTDINDEAQTIYFPEIGTTAKDAASGTQFSTAGKITLVDTVSYSNLNPGTEYTLKGILMDQNTGEAVKIEDREITAETTFKPETASGTVDVTFAFDASSLTGHVLVVFEELFQTDISIAEHKDLTDEGQTIYIPEIGTTALDKESGTHNSRPDNKVTIVDTVTYKGLIPGKEYTIKGILMDKSTGKELLVNGKTVTAEKNFTAEKAEGSVELTFTFDGSALAGKTVVAFEHMYYEEKEVGSHTDMEDEDQSIHFPAIETMAKASSTKDHIANAGKATIIDTVSYKNLIPGQKYTLKGVLMDKETGKELIIGEKKITAEKAFTPKESDKSVDLEYAFDASALAGRQVVVFEELYINGELIAEHKDIADEGQTIHFPELHTSATDGATGNHTGTCHEKATVIDTVTYKGLIPGKEYTLKGTLMNNATGEPVKDSEGKEVTAEKTFTPEKADGSVELVYELDSSLLAGETVVVFEDLFYNGVLVGSHADITDEDQSVHYPDLGTQAKDKTTGLSKGVRKEQTVIVDTVAYKNLIPGKEYAVKGVLMDKSTGKEVLIDGKTVTAEKNFTPEKADGSIELEFAFDSTAMENPAVVVFERLYVQGIEVATHTDINDEGQTVEYPEHKLQTQAKDKTSGTQEAEAKANVTIVDTVTYEGLIPGQSYTLKGVLMDKTTGEPLRINNKQITAEKIFIPEKSSGTAEMEFTFDATFASGKEVVVFERLYVQGTEVAAHADIQDKAQTVKIKEPVITENAEPSKAAPVKTGDKTPVGGILCVMLLSAAVIITAVRKKSRKDG